MKAIILAAGYATRLYPLTLNQPKPLLNLGNRPMIERTIEKIEKIDEIDTIYIVTNDKFKIHFDGWLLRYSSNKSIKIINDGTLSNEDRLGAVGDINFVIEQEKIDDDLLVVAGDNLFKFDLKDLISVKKEKDASILAVRDLEDPKLLSHKFGTILQDQDKKIINFEEKPEEPKSSLAATAIYLFKKEDVQEIKNCLRENPKLDNSGEFIKYLISKKPVYAYIVKGEWFDIGSKEELIEADKKYGGNEY